MSFHLRFLGAPERPAYQIYTDAQARPRAVGAHLALVASHFYVERHRPTARQEVQMITVFTTFTLPKPITREEARGQAWGQVLHYDTLITHRQLKSNPNSIKALLN
jgi:hypothetical protein